MARVHYWQFLVNEEGQPIEGAAIGVYVASSTSAARYFDREYGGIAQTSTTSVPTITTNANGYFEFWIADNEEPEGYENQTKFKIEWQKSGVAYGSINFVDILPNILEGEAIDVTDTDTTKNKFVSNYYGKLWTDHLNTVVTGGTVHGIEPYLLTESDLDYNKIIANYDAYNWNHHMNVTYNSLIPASGDVAYAHGIEEVDENDDADTTKNKLISNRLMNLVYTAVGGSDLRTALLDKYTDLGTSSGAIDIDVGTYKVQHVALNGDSTITFTNWVSASGYAENMTLEITSGGSHTVNFSSRYLISAGATATGTVIWSTVTSATALSSGGLDSFEFYTTNGGQTVKAFQAGRNMK